MGKKVTSIGYSAFIRCDSLKSVTIPNGVTSIGSEAFKNCISFKSVTIPNSVTSIGSEAFDDCTSLKSITIPKSVNSIGYYAFGYYHDDVMGSWMIFMVPDFKIYCYEGTAGEQYALDNGFDYTLLLSGVTGFKASSKSATSVTLKWDKNNSATGYIIQQYNGNKWVNIATISDNSTVSYKVSGLTPCTRYAFRIQSCNKVIGQVLKSDFTDKLVVYTNPKAISGFKVSEKTDTQLVLSWQKDTSVTGYIIEMYKDGKWERMAKTTSNNVSSCVVKNRTPSTRYAFRIRSYKNIGSGAVKSAYTKKLVAYTNPKAVSGFKCGGKTNNVIRLNWTKNTSATGYIIEQYKGNKWVRIAKITSNSTTTYRVTGLKANTRYAFRIQAYKNIPGSAVRSTFTNKLVIYTKK